MCLGGAAAGGDVRPAGPTRHHRPALRQGRAAQTAHQVVRRHSQTSPARLVNVFLYVCLCVVLM